MAEREAQPVPQAYAAALGARDGLGREVDPRHPGPAASGELLGQVAVAAAQVKHAAAGVEPQQLPQLRQLLGVHHVELPQVLAVDALAQPPVRGALLDVAQQPVEARRAAQQARRQPIEEVAEASTQGHGSMRGERAPRVKGSRLSLPPPSRARV